MYLKWVENTYFKLTFTISFKYSFCFFIFPSYTGIGFFAAGFDTSSNTMSTLSYNLAMNPKIQDTIYEEIKSVLKESDGVIDHETINKIEY